MKLAFGDIVVVDGENIGVIVKSWLGNGMNSEDRKTNNHDVYVRMYNEIKNYKESDIERYMVRHKYLSEEELDWQSNAINDTL